MMDQPHSQDLRTEAVALCEQIDGVQRFFRESAAEPAVSADALAAQAYRELLAGGMSDAFAQRITENTTQAWHALSRAQRRAGAASFRQTLVECIINELDFAPASRYNGDDTRPIVVFTGPPGVGKSTTLIKVAMQEFLGRGIPVRIISVDPHHYAACHEKIGTLAGMIGANFTAANSMPEFCDAAEDHWRGALLIDTPGYAATENESAREVSAFLMNLKPKETHLVLPAWMAKEDLMRLVRQYEDFAPDYLLFTKLDETDSYGALISAALEAGKPLSFLANGQNMPEDLEAANPSVLFASLFHGRRVETAWVAESAIRAEFRPNIQAAEVAMTRGIVQ